jgi:prepilin-type N-terminal cleavage/methylation domain-containing protein
VRSNEGGFTMTEIMVSVLLVGIAAAFTFSIQVRSSAAFRDQSNVSEAQQGLRAASELLGRDLRSAGRRVTRLYSPAFNGGALVRPVLVDNAAWDETDSVTVVYGDANGETFVPAGGGAFNANSTPVSSSAGYAVTERILLTRAPTGGAVEPIGAGCLLEITGVAPGSLVHASGGSWNAGGGVHCDEPNLKNFGDGSTLVSKAVTRTYRIRPSDVRGVLEMSPSAGVTPGDWQAIAVGIVDLQVAMRVFEEADTVDVDADGDPERDWYSGNDMELGTGIPIELVVTLVARTTREISGAGAASTPDLTVSGNEDHNQIGDHAAIALPVTDGTSRYFGNHAYRTMQLRVDLRNSGVGQ